MLPNMESVQREFALEPAELSPEGRYTAVIAVNDDIGPHQPSVDLRGMSLDTYMRNPVVGFEHGWEGSVPVGRTTGLRWTNRGLEAQFEFLPGDVGTATILHSTSS